MSRAVKQRAAELKFDLVGIAPAARPDTFDQFKDWLRRGLHATMDYLPRRAAAYENPTAVLQMARSLIVVAVQYGGAPSADGTSASPRAGQIASYAQGTGDYHDLLRPRLKELAAVLHERSPVARTRVVIDTAPILERDVARRAGLGWFGKNTMLLHKRLGSYFFLGVVLTDAVLEPDAPHATSHCGTCTRCLEACPTDAFPEPGVLDAGRCISYLTIERRNESIPESLRSGIGDWLFGCDVCQQVCPWNRKAPPAQLTELQADEENLPDPRELLSLDDETFERKYGQTPFARPGRAGMARNAAIVIGNTGTSSDVPMLRRSLGDVSPLVRGASAWALGQIGGTAARETLRLRRQVEQDHEVIGELTAALARFEARNGLPRNDASSF